MLVASASRALESKFDVALQSGHFKGTLARVASYAWGNVATHSIVRKIHVPDRVRAITVGGATLGGSGKTPVAIAWARREAERGARVALIGHAYRAHPERARVVSPTDDVRCVGDEALVCARALFGVAEVVVAPKRQAAVDFAIARGAEVVVFDGVAQLAPRRADVALLVVDENMHARCCPPAGDLRAPLAALYDACDFIVSVSDAIDIQRGRGDFNARVVCDGARAPSGSVVPFSELAKMRVGLALGVAHPERVVRMLARRGVEPIAFSFVCDHRGDRLRPVMRTTAQAMNVDAWLISEKCASFVSPTSHDTPPIYVITHTVDVLGTLP